MTTTPTNVIPAAPGFYVVIFHTEKSGEPSEAVWGWEPRLFPVIGWSIPVEVERGHSINHVVAVTYNDPYVELMLEKGETAYRHDAMLYPNGTVVDEGGPDFTSVEEWKQYCLRGRGEAAS